MFGSYKPLYKARFAHLELERLESRLVPAANTYLWNPWLVGDRNWSTNYTSLGGLSNWEVKSPEGIFVPTDKLPGPIDTVIFDGKQSQSNCTVDMEADAEIKRIEVINGYTGTITLQSDLILRDFATVVEPSTFNAPFTLRSSAKTYPGMQFER
jgi:hypothetical protein